MELPLNLPMQKAHSEMEVYLQRAKWEGRQKNSLMFVIFVFDLFHFSLNFFRFRFHFRSM